MARIKGIAVTLIQKTEDGIDPFGAPIYKEKEATVKNVLVAPVSTEERLNALNLTGKRAIYQLAIPKGDTHDWEDQRVRFFGKEWRTFGEAEEGIEHLIPLDWNKKVMVERINGKS